MSIAENVARIRSEMEAAALACGRDPKEIQLCAATKMNDADAVRQAIAAGVDCCGENRVQELTVKLAQNAYEGAPVHFIGHLQTNKVKYIAPYVSMIEAVDSLKLLKEIEKQGAKNNRVIDVLLELHIAEEETKYGLTLDACRQLLEEGEWRNMAHVRICGLMMMASYVEDEAQIRQEFRTAHNFFDEVKQRYFAESPYFTQRSWGMSHDYPIAVEEGSTMVRVGTAIFGPRVY